MQKKLQPKTINTQSLWPNFKNHIRRSLIVEVFLSSKNDFEIIFQHRRVNDLDQNDLIRTIQKEVSSHIIPSELHRNASFFIHKIFVSPLNTLKGQAEFIRLRVVRREFNFRDGWFESQMYSYIYIWIVLFLTKCAHFFSIIYFVYPQNIFIFQVLSSDTNYLYFLNV